ncbi:MAG: DUF1015 domain-containing protein [Candidatus Omnitrophota bacterium]
MAELKPFRGLIYSASKIGGDYSGVVAPPYDVIPENMRDELYGKNKYNVIRLILGKALENDNEEYNKYTRAKNFLAEWQDQDVLVRDEAASFYVYEQEYEYGGQTYRRIGFLGLMKIEEPGEKSVIPHEYTLAKPKEDRMNLIKQVKANLSPIFVLYEDTGGTITDILTKTTSSASPEIDVKLGDGKHKLWRLCDKDSVDKIVSLMKGKKVYIADGHHRYEVAMAYRNARREDGKYDGSADYILMYFTDMIDAKPHNNLTVAATHRAIKVMPVADEELAEKIAEYFDVTECKSLSELMEGLGEGKTGEHAFGYFGGNKYFLIKLRKKNDLSKLIPEEKSMEWKRLDVSILHSGIFKNLLKVKESEGNITYVKNSSEAEELVKNGSHTAAFFLNPTRVEQIKAVAEEGDMMPQKSTYFYPKLLSGLVINKFD